MVWDQVHAGANPAPPTIFHKNKVLKMNKDKLKKSRSSVKHQLQKIILFKLVQETKKDICYQCGKKIEDIDSFSIEHKVPWLDSDNPKKLFFDLDNIAFSHIDCNISAARKTNKKIKD